MASTSNRGGNNPVPGHYLVVLGTSAALTLVPQHCGPVREVRSDFILTGRTKCRVNIYCGNCMHSHTVQQGQGKTPERRDGCIRSPVVLEYSRSTDSREYGRSSISLYGIQVCSYVLPIRHWTWRYITIVNSQVFRLQLLGTH